MLIVLWNWDVTNKGNVSTDRNEVASFDVFARSLDGGVESKLTTVEVKLGNLRPDASKAVKLPITFPASIAEGSYDVVIYNGGTELELGSTVNISEPFIELSGAIDELKSSSVIIAGDSGSVEVVLEITNNGNDTTGKSQAIDIDVYGKVDGGSNILMGTVANENIGGLAAGKSKKLTIEVPVPSALETGSYQLIVFIDSGNAIPEVNEDDNWIAMASNLNMSIVSSLEDIMMPVESNNMQYSTVMKGNIFEESGPGTISGVFSEIVNVDGYDYSVG